MPTSPQAAAVIEAYTPLLVSDAVAVFARAVVGAADPPSAARAKALLYAASRLGAFAESVGMELSPEVVLRTAVIERFMLAIRTTVSHPTRRTLHSNLKAILAARTIGPRPASLGRERAKAPYSPAQIAAYLALGDAQGSEARRMRACGLICLGAGAGLAGADLRSVSGHHVIVRSGGLVVEVSGRGARSVPVLADYHDRLKCVAAYFGERFIVGGVDPARRNVTTRLVASLSGGADLPRVDTGRLRATWLAAVAEGIGLRGFMDAAGISCSQRLGDIIAGLERLDEASLVAKLGGRA